MGKLGIFDHSSKVALYKTFVRHMLTYRAVAGAVGNVNAKRLGVVKEIMLFLIKKKRWLEN